MTIYSIASNFKVDLHRFLQFPLYYIFYNCWIKVFGNSDTVIRFMSVFFDILGIISAFYAGRQLAINLEINKNRTGFYYMLLFAINSSFIYYAQEAKFYSLTFFVVNILVIAWLKFIQNPDHKNFIFYYVAGLLLILSYVSQSLLVLILYIVTLIMKAGSKKQVFIYPTVFIPVLIFCTIIPKYFSGNFDAVVFDNSFILLMFQNWFSPVLTGLQNNILNYHLYVFSHILNIKFLLFVIFPLLYLCCGIGIALKKFRIARYLFLVVCSYVVFHIFATYLTHYNVLVRYTLPVLPLVLLISSAGICRIKNRVILILFIIVNLLGIFSLSGAPYIPRPDGYRALADVLYKNEIEPGYDFVLPIRTELLDKYFYITGNRVSLYVLNSPEAQETYLSDAEISGLVSDNNKNKYYKRFLEENKISPDFEKYVLENFVRGKTLVILKDKSICMFTDEQLKLITKSKNYEQYPLQFLRLSKLTNNMVKVLGKHYRLVKNFSAGNWEIFVFKL